MNFTKHNEDPFQENIILTSGRSEKSLFDRTLEKLERHQNIGAHETGDLYDYNPPRPDEVGWDPKGRHLGYVKEECDPYSCRAKIGYNPILPFLSLFIPNIVEKIGEHEGTHLGQPGKDVLFHIYYDSWDDKIKYGQIEADSIHKYPIGRGIIEGGVKVARGKKDGVKQTSYPESSKFAEELDRLLPLNIIHKLAYTAQKKLMQKKRVDHSFDIYKIKMKDRPKELQDLLYALNMPVIKDRIRSYATRSKTDLYIV